MNKNNVNNNNKKVLFIISFILAVTTIGILIVCNYQSKQVNKNIKEDSAVNYEGYTAKDNELESNDNNVKIENEKIKYNKQETECIYKIKVTNKDGAKVYDTVEYEEQDVIGVIEYGTVLECDGDCFDQTIMNATRELNIEYDYDIALSFFEAIKDEYYYLSIIDPNDKKTWKYVKFSDIEPLKDTIIMPNKIEEKFKICVTDENCLFDGPGMCFYPKDDSNSVKIGTIFEIDEKIGEWLHVKNEKNEGWVLKTPPHPTNFVYYDVYYGNAHEVEDRVMNVRLTKDTNMIKDLKSYDVVEVIPKGTELMFDYNVNLMPGDIAYHLNYQDKEGYIRDIPADYLSNSMSFDNFVIIE